MHKYLSTKYYKKKILRCLHFTIFISELMFLLLEFFNYETKVGTILHVILHITNARH